MIVAILLFSLNILVSLLVLRQEFHWRFRHIGQELAFLATGVIATHLHGGRTFTDGVILLAVMLLYVLFWLAIFGLSAVVMQDRQSSRHPFVFLTIALGLVTVWSALSDLPFIIAHRIVG
jgi:hypothetical protein